MQNLSESIQQDIGTVALFRNAFVPLSDSQNDQMLDGMEKVLKATGYEIILNESAGWTFRQPGGNYSYLWFEGEVEAIKHAYSDLLGETDSTNLKAIQQH